MLYHTKVAVDGIGSVHKEGRRAGRVESSNNFLGDDGAFANARHHNSTGAGLYSFNCFLKVFANKLFEAGNRAGFGADGLYGGGENIIVHAVQR